MMRASGVYHDTGSSDEPVRCFIPHPLPPQDPVLELDEVMLGLLRDAEEALHRFKIAACVVPSAQWFVYGFIRKEAVISSQIEGTQATLQDLANYEATSTATPAQAGDMPADVEEVCNYVAAYQYARQQIRDPAGLPVSRRLLCETHKILMNGVRGADKLPGQVRHSQNWIGGSRPGNAHFVPAPPEYLERLLSDLEQWIHGNDHLPPLIRAGLAHVQFESIHPFLDGNGRVGRMLISLLFDHWNITDGQLLYVSLAFKRRQNDYYQLLAEVRSHGNWEKWCHFFLDCVRVTAEDGIHSVHAIFTIIHQDRKSLLAHSSVTVNAIRLFELLPEHPIVTTAQIVGLLEISKPTAQKSIDSLVSVGIITQTSGKSRDRAYTYHRYMHELSRD